MEWNIVEEDEQASPSDHVTIEWKWAGKAERVDLGWKIRDWALKEKLDKEREEKKLKTKEGPTLGEVWLGWAGTLDGLGMVAGPFSRRPHLNDESRSEDLGDEIEWIQDTLISILNERTRKITICAR